MGGRVVRGAVLAWLGAAFLLLPPLAADADELRRLYSQILRDPTNSELNFRYAELAEERGELRKALSAYERILLNDPEHPDVRRALQRVRRMLQPDITQIFAELGAAWESNPRRLSGDDRGDLLALARVRLRDERRIGTVRWRTDGNLAGNFYRDENDLRYGYGGGQFGPVIDVTPTLAMHAAVGGGAAYFDRRLLYSEATATLTFESYLEGAYHSVRVRGGWRKYDDHFPSSEGFYTDITGKFSRPNVLGNNDVFIVSPWFRWSGIRGSGFSLIVPSERIEPGRYIEYGARLEYYRRLTEWLTLGGSLAVSRRDYKRSTDIFALATTRRRDRLISPGATIILHQVMGYQTDLRTDYRYEDNNSNATSRSYTNHIVTMMLVSRF